MTSPIGTVSLKHRQVNMMTSVDTVSLKHRQVNIMTSVDTVSLKHKTGEYYDISYRNGVTETQTSEHDDICRHGVT